MHMSPLELLACLPVYMQEGSFFLYLWDLSATKPEVKGFILGEKNKQKQSFGQMTMSKCNVKNVVG